MKKGKVLHKLILRKRRAARKGLSSYLPAFWRQKRMMHKTAAIVFVLIVCFSPAALVKGADVEIEGLVLDQTLTRIGHEFYHEFVSLWEPPEGIGGYNIIIKERADPRWGSQVLIYVNDVMLLSYILGTRSGAIKGLVEESVRIVKVYLFRLSLERKLEVEDLLGDGF